MAGAAFLLGPADPRAPPCRGRLGRRGRGPAPGIAARKQGPGDWGLGLPWCELGALVPQDETRRQIPRVQTAAGGWGLGRIPTPAQPRPGHGQGSKSMLPSRVVGARGSRPVSAEPLRGGIRGRTGIPRLRPPCPQAGRGLGEGHPQNDQHLQPKLAGCPLGQHPGLWRMSEGVTLGVR